MDLIMDMIIGPVLEIVKFAWGPLSKIFSSFLEGMELIGPVLEIVKLAWDPIGRRIGYIKNLKKNMKELNKVAGDLFAERNDVGKMINSSRPEEATAVCTKWLKDVKDIEDQVSDIQKEYKEDKKCLAGWRPNVCSKMKLGKRVEEIIKEITDLNDKRSTFKGTELFDAPLEKVRPQNTEVNSSTAAESTLQKILGFIEDDKIEKIGIWGMGGIGKTTVMKLLNNRLEVSQSFETIIWITVSKEGNERRVQGAIAERLKLDKSESDDEVRAKIHQALSGKKFLSLLDDVWNMINLSDVGVPTSNHHVNGCKVVLTTRSLHVCRQMKTDEEVKVETLSDDEAWKLFTENTGDVAMTPHVESIARDIVAECDRLPLAIIVVGSSLRKIRDVVMWKNTLRELQLPTASQIEAIEERVFRCLRSSYDLLQDDSKKKLFLYCSLYPEDNDILIDELVEYCWLEGYIHGVGSIEVAREKGHSMVMNLVDASLLKCDKEGYVKMHDVVRDFALREARGFLVKAGMNINLPLEEKEWLQMQKISFMKSNLCNLLLERPNCSTLSTLLLQHNYQLTMIPDSFFECMHSLYILDLSGTKINFLSSSLWNLVNLRGLYLNDCNELEELPFQIGALKGLEVLHLGGSTTIQYLPREVGELTRLKSLIVRFQYRNYSQNNDDEACSQDDDTCSKDDDNEDLCSKDDDNEDLCSEDNDDNDACSQDEDGDGDACSQNEDGDDDDACSQDEDGDGDACSQNGDGDGDGDACSQNEDGDGDGDACSQNEDGDGDRVGDGDGDGDDEDACSQDDDGEDTKEWNMKLRVPTGIIPKLSLLEELSLYVYPFKSYFGNRPRLCAEKEQWDDESMEVVVEELCRLKNLTYLDAYFPKVECLQHFLRHSKSVRATSSWFRRFRFRVGTEIRKGPIICHPDREWERCLIYNSGFGTSHAAIMETLAHCSFFRLQHHHTARKLSELGLANMNKLKECVVESCVKMETLFDGDEPQETCALLPNLEILRLGYLPELRSFCDGPLLPGRLSKLTTLYLCECNNLKKVFQLGIIRQLYSLEFLSVDHCSAMKEIIEIEEEEEMSVASHAHNVISHNNDRLILPNINKISLSYLSELVSICRGFSNLEWPSLQTIEIRKCPKLKSLSFLANMNELKECVVESCEKMEILFDGDEQHETCALLPNLESLILRNLPKLRSLCDGPLLPGSLSKLTKLNLSGCNNLKKVFQLGIIRQLCSLESLSVYNCSALKEIIEIEEEMSLSVSSHTHNAISYNNDRLIILHNIKEIHLSDLPELVSICRGCSNFEWPSLQTIEILLCPKLKSLSFLSNGTKIVAPALRAIEGWSKWWEEGLEWEDNDIKQRLQPFHCEPNGCIIS